MASDPKARSASNAGTTADSRQAKIPPQGELPERLIEQEARQNARPEGTQQAETPPQGDLPERLVKEQAEQNARKQDTKQSPKDPTKENPDA